MQRKANAIPEGRPSPARPLQLKNEVDDRKTQQKQIQQNSSLQVRDLYNREQKLAYWISRADKDLEGTDLKDVQKFIQDMQDKEKASLWIIRCITVMLSVRKQLQKPLRRATKRDMRALLEWMKARNYKPATHEKYRQVIKLFYKTVYGKGQTCPEKVAWFSTKLSKERRLATPALDLNEYLEDEEVEKLIANATTPHNRAFLACMYETGARPEEFLRLTNKDIKREVDGIPVILRGKTGERRVKIVTYAAVLEHWLSVHPLKDHEEYPLWISEATNYKNKPLGLRGAEKMIKATMAKAGLSGKHSRLYILRHSRATRMANYLTEAKLCHMFGWVVGSAVVRRYVHLAGRDLDDQLVALAQGGVPKVKEYVLKTLKCGRCHESMSPGMKFCGRCGLSSDLTEQYVEGQKEREKQRESEARIGDLQRQLMGLQSELQVVVDSLGLVSQDTRNELARQLYTKGVFLATDPTLAGGVAGSRGGSP